MLNANTFPSMLTIPNDGKLNNNKIFITGKSMGVVNLTLLFSTSKIYIKLRIKIVIVQLK